MTLSSELQTRDKKLLDHDNHHQEVKELSQDLSVLNHETKSLRDRVPQLESVVQYLNDKLHAERER